MAGECVLEGPDPKEMSEEALWELINDNRHRISLGVRPCILIPYLRQVRVLSEVDEDEILSCHNLTNRCMRTSEFLSFLLLGSFFSKHLDYSGLEARPLQLLDQYYQISMF